jgi:hypothetical protein
MVEAFQTQPELARVAVDPFLPVRSKVNIMNTIMKDSQATEITKRLFGERLQPPQHAAEVLVHGCWQAPGSSTAVGCTATSPQQQVVLTQLGDTLTATQAAGMPAMCCSLERHMQSATLMPVVHVGAPLPRVLQSPQQAQP